MARPVFLCFRRKLQEYRVQLLKRPERSTFLPLRPFYRKSDRLWTNQGSKNGARLLLGAGLVFAGITVTLLDLTLIKNALPGCGSSRCCSGGRCKAPAHRSPAKNKTFSRETGFCSGSAYAV